MTRSKLAEIFRHIAEALKHDRVGELADVRIARTLERDRPYVFWVTRHPFGAPDCRALALAFLRLSGHDAIFRSKNGQRDVVGQSHRSRSRSKSSDWFHALTARAHRQELDLRKVDLVSSIGAFLGAIKMIVIAVGASAIKGLLA